GMGRSLSVVVLAASVLASGCVAVHRSSSRPLEQAVIAPGGSVGGDLSFALTPVATSGTQTVRNVTYFDLASCFPAPPLVTGLYGDEQLLGALTAARPAVLECLVPPAHRGRRDRTSATVTAVVRPGSGMELTAGGENITSAGQQCVLEAARAALA